MTVMDTIDRIITHPLTVVSTIVGLLTSLFQIPFLDALAATIWAQAGLVFGFVSVSSTVGVIPEGTGQVAMAIAGALFLGRMGQKLWESYESRLNDD